MIPGLLGWLLLAPVAVLAGVFLTEVALGLPAGRPRRQAAAATDTVVLMPAHDEAATIAGIVAPLVASLPATARLLVVADNCTDDTAAVARAHGAEVIERRDAARRGKGFALDFGRSHLGRRPPACVVIVDADCVVTGDGVAALAARAMAADAAVQARYLLEADRAAPPMVQISTFAFLVKNLVRQRGAARLGAPAVLTGSGMALPWRLFATVPLGGSDLVEDLAMGLALVDAGEPPRYCDGVTVTSAAAGEAATLVQRTRWEHGFLDTARRRALPLIGRSLGQGRFGATWLGLHLLTPPLALLLMACAGVTLMEGVLVALGMAAAPLVAMLAIDLALGLAVLACWASIGRAVLAPGTLLRLPLYALWKVPVYLGFVGKRQTEWVRTERR